MMDFRTEAGYSLTYTVEPITGEYTFTIKDLAEVTTIGTIQVEPEKLRCLLDSLAEIGKNIRPDTVPGNAKWRMFYEKNAQKATTEFNI